MAESTIYRELEEKYATIEQKLRVLQSQYDALKEDHRDLRTQYARLSAEAMRLQSLRSSEVSRVNQEFIANQYPPTQHSTTAFAVASAMASSITHSASDSYHMITDNIAIGDLLSDYTPFDVVINLNFECNSLHFNHHDLKTSTSVNKQVTYIAIYDSPEEKAFMKMVLYSVIPTLIQFLRQYPLSKVLFHCYAGISRSASLGIALLAHMENLSYEVAFERVKEKRGQVKPNSGFVEAIKEYLEETRQVENMVLI